VGGVGGPGGDHFGGDGGAARGGAVYNAGSLTLRNSTVSGNFASGGSGGSGLIAGVGGTAEGAGVHDAGTLTVVGSTLAGNVAQGGTFDGPANGGGIFHAGSGTASLRNSIVAGNDLAGSNVGLMVGPDLFGGFTSAGWNLIGKGDGSTGVSNGTNGDQVGSTASPLDPMITALQDNGGSTRTRALLPGSPAIDQGSTGVVVDQRGEIRPYDDPTVVNAGPDGDDIGAVERQAPTLAVTDTRLVETPGGIAARFSVTLADGSAGASVVVATANGTAVGPGDFVPVGPTTLTFAAGEVRKDVTVTVNDDALDEAGEAFFLDLSAPVGAVVRDGRGRALVSDDDATPSLRIDDATVTEGSTGTTAARFRVRLSAPSGRPVTVSYATANGTALAPADYSPAGPATVTFEPGQTVRTIQVPVVGDRRDEPAETFVVELSDPVGTVLADDRAIGTIKDDDLPPTMSVNDVTVTEGDTGTVTATFTVSLSARSGRTITVQYATANSTATAPADYTALNPTTLTLPAGQLTATVRVAVRGDLVDEADEDFFLRLTAPTHATLADAEGVGRITDDD
jgi:hypothetical protein